MEKKLLLFCESKIAESKRLTKIIAITGEYIFNHPLRKNPIRDIAVL